MVSIIERIRTINIMKTNTTPCGYIRYNNILKT